MNHPDPASQEEPRCNHEGWAWGAVRTGPYGGPDVNMPYSVYCVRRKGHDGPHQSGAHKTLLHHGQQRVYEWQDK